MKILRFINFFLRLWNFIHANFQSVYFLCKQRPPRTCIVFRTNQNFWKHTEFNTIFEKNSEKSVFNTIFFPEKFCLSIALNFLKGKTFYTRKKRKKTLTKYAMYELFSIFIKWLKSPKSLFVIITWKCNV